MIRVPILCSRLSCSRNVPLLRRNFGSETAAQEMPGFIQPIIQYASDAYLTQGLQASIAAIHSLDVPWAASFVLAGLALRILTAPAHIAAERLLSKRVLATSFLTKELFVKVSERYKIPIVFNPQTKEPEFGHHNKEVNDKAKQNINMALQKYFKEQRLQKPRIMLMKISTMPLWIFSSFAIRNILTDDFGIGLNKFLWIDSIVQPDPFFVLPVAVGLCGFYNFYTQRLAFPAMMSPAQKKIQFNDVIFAASMVVAVAILTKMPACLSLYWLSVSVTGILQAHLLKLPKVRKFLKIKLPHASAKPT